MLFDKAAAAAAAYTRVVRVNRHVEFVSVCVCVWREIQTMQRADLLRMCCEMWGAEKSQCVT